MYDESSVKDDLRLCCSHATKSGFLEFKSRHMYEPRHEISNNVVCASSKASDQPAHTRSLIRAFANHLNIPRVLSY